MMDEYNGLFIFIISCIGIFMVFWNLHLQKIVDELAAFVLESTKQQGELNNKILNTLKIVGK